ncbi:MAG: head maturation protease, ClpP-related [Faecousia sp.]
MKNLKTKRYDMKATRNGKTEAHGYIDMKAQDTGAELYLYGDIVDDDLTAAYFGGTCPQAIADFVNGLNPNTPMTIYFNSGGGDVFAGLAIHSILKRHTGKKIGQVDGMAASIASTILMSCDEIVVNTGAQIMVHDPWTCAQGNSRDLRKTADLLDTAKESMLDVYMGKAREGVTRDQVAGLLAAETWMRGEKAAEYFDLGTKDAPAAAAAASTVFGSYKNLPDDLKKAETEKENHQKRADALLNDLYLYGT